ncbi:MAG TPA: succinate dehydrogenase/fumarate reductase iron-sulfur subunit [candidate division Zixibacteria bacterium]|mgnify:FL=1|nr:succinate dehydrogenase/fumarate reductase iron-sulfur subunit [candidate division Zixibacteria bacterium]MDD4917104.1 succinate dehydrogenase/fumarate reductase iron-sulfur subunit [candidate division Zixibacteria bacterium]MDM7972712.1 succinate dehydrogenase/fumarate reductase iron-sulfur subunit [candidate division Zixibacteria bacterium]HOZ08258.1 succinate dehydrogenase/fumarate reductase iron-sulfur subunit [candidate division Zixibacteria bacterium]HPI32618.1 succinate dehydrogenase/
MNLTLYVWRQKDGRSKGRMERYEAKNVNEHMSFLEMLDVVNEELIEKGEEPIAFDSDCREGICGTCGMMINGIAHGPQRGTTVCQLHMRFFKDGDQIYIEPFRSRAFPIVKDLVIDRSALDRVIAAGGFVSVNTGAPPDGNAVPISKKDADTAFDAAACIQCGACVAACKNASAMLFVGAKVSHLANLPQGRVEAAERVRRMVWQMDREGFGNCTNYFECSAACPKEIPVRFIAQMNRELYKSKAASRAGAKATGGAG